MITLSKAQVLRLHSPSRCPSIPPTSNTTLGAQVQRMEVMGKNIVTSQENTQASESVIRDADMAKSMTNYVKENVLSQSASAMLAQANQHASRVMNLLQA